MQDNRCPNCENDITTSVNTTIIAMLDAGDSRPRALTCPHCTESLIVSATITRTLQREAVIA
jgi:predicted RNA-binding Zn-ribbon protein involved in translation (DUF1610 family)